MANIVYRDGSESYTFDFVDLATVADWSPIDHVELCVGNLTLVSRTPGEFWRQVQELAGVVQYA